MSTPSSKGPGPEDPVARERAVARVIERTLRWIADEIPDDVIATADARTISASVSWYDVGERLMATAAPLEAVIVDTARATIPRAALAKADEPVEIAFDLVDELAVSYAAQHSGRLVIEISTKLRDMIATVVSGTVATTMPRGALDKVLREFIPLHTAWAVAVDRAVGRAYEAALANGLSIERASAEAQKIGRNRARALARRRAENIARTEVMTAMHEGKYAGWNESIVNGWMPVDSVKEWVEGRDPCSQCEPLVGELRAWDEPFSNGQMMPPHHPSCRCTAALLPPDADVLARLEAQRDARALTA